MRACTRFIRRTGISMLVFSLGLPGIAAAADMLMNPGLWEHTISMEMPGMPVMPQPMTVSQCLTPEEATDWEGALARINNQQDGNCQVSDVRRDGDTVRWNMSCAGEMPMQGSGEMAYSNGAAYTGTLQMTMNGPGGEMSMTQQLTGKHVGECKK